VRWGRRERGSDRVAEREREREREKSGGEWEQSLVVEEKERMGQGGIERRAEHQNIEGGRAAVCWTYCHRADVITLLSSSLAKG